MIDEIGIRVLQARIAAFNDALEVAEEEIALMRASNIPDRITGLLEITKERLARLEAEREQV